MVELEPVSLRGQAARQLGLRAQIRGWIYGRGGLSPHLIYLTGRELATMYPACREEDHSLIARQDAGPAHALSRPLSSNFASSRKARRKPL